MITTDIEAVFAQHANVITVNSIEVRTFNHLRYLSGARSDGRIPVRAESIASKVVGVTRGAMKYTFLISREILHL